MFLINGQMGTLDNIFKELNQNSFFRYRGHGGTWSYEKGYDYDPKTTNLLLFEYLIDDIKGIVEQLKQKYPNLFFYKYDIDGQQITL